MPLSVEGRRSCMAVAESDEGWRRSSRGMWRVWAMAVRVEWRRARAKGGGGAWEGEAGGIDGREDADGEGE